MWSPSTFTIVFRGLLVFHLVENRNGQRRFDIGVLPEEGHFLRINTITNCVLAGVFPLEAHVRRTQPFWRLAVDNPVGGGISIHTSGTQFDRLTHPDEKDFRWLTDIEGREFYDRELTEELDTCPLMPILRVYNGIFYTRLKSTQLERRQGNGQFELFGSIAGVVGCDIPILGGRVRLMQEDTGVRIFPFKVEPNTIYEFANTPPDIGPHDEHRARAAAALAAGDRQGEAEPERAEDAAREAAAQSADDDVDHFQSYYRLFTNPDPDERFRFQKPGGDPAPDPALCGATGLSRRQVPLR